jgi:hypothetical protein
MPSSARHRHRTWETRTWPGDQGCPWPHVMPAERLGLALSVRVKDPSHTVTEHRGSERAERRLFTGDSASVGVGRARPDQLFRCTPGNSPGTQQCRFLVGSDSGRGWKQGLGRLPQGRVAGHVDPVADLLQLDPVRGIPGPSSRRNRARAPVCAAGWRCPAGRCPPVTRRSHCSWSGTGLAVIMSSSACSRAAAPSVLAMAPFCPAPAHSLAPGSMAARPQGVTIFLWVFAEGHR